MVALRDVQKDTINEEEEGFDVEELAPTEAEVEKELSEALVVDAFSVHLFSLHDSTCLPCNPSLL